MLTKSRPTPRHVLNVPEEQHTVCVNRLFVMSPRFLICNLQTAVTWLKHQNLTQRPVFNKCSQHSVQEYHSLTSTLLSCWHSENHFRAFPTRGVVAGAGTRQRRRPLTFLWLHVWILPFCFSSRQPPPHFVFTLYWY